MTTASVDKFIKSQPDPQVREDCAVISRLMSEATGEKAQMWGSSIVGFGTHHYKYDTGREGDMPIIGFSPRKQNLTLYLTMYGFDQEAELLKKLGKHSLGKGCLYIKRLSDVDLPTLKTLIRRAAKPRRS